MHRIAIEEIMKLRFNLKIKVKASSLFVEAYHLNLYLLRSSKMAGKHGNWLKFDILNKESYRNKAMYLTHIYLIFSQLVINLFIFCHIKNSWNSKCLNFLNIDGFYGINGLKCGRPETLSQRLKWKCECSIDRFALFSWLSLWTVCYSAYKSYMY